MRVRGIVHHPVSEHIAYATLGRDGRNEVPRGELQRYPADVLSITQVFPRGIGTRPREGRETTLAGSVLLFQLDDARLVVDADGAEFLENVLSEEAVHGSTEAAGKFVHIQNINRMGDPDAIGEREIRAEAHSVALHTEAPIVAVEITHLKLRTAVGFGADNGVVGASINQERGAIVVDTGIHKDHGLHGAERNGDHIGFIRESRRRHEK
jgi:hypothetical protein